MTDGAFTPAARAAVLTATLDRCAGCRTGERIEVHHKRPRGMGGTSNALIAEPFNGLALCATCHEWTETHRDTARLLGWLTPAPTPDAPFWTATWGWCRWLLLTDQPACWCITTNHHPTHPDRHTAVNTYRRQRNAAHTP